MFDEEDPNFTQFIYSALSKDNAELIEEFLSEPDNLQFVFEPITAPLPDAIQYKCPIMCAIVYFDAVKSFELAIKAGCSTNTADAFGKSSAHFAAEFGRLDLMVNPLFDKTEYLVIDWRGWLPLHYAAKNNHLEVAKFIVEEKNIDFTLPDKYGMTALHVACKYGSTDVAKYLIEKGGNLQEVDFLGRSCLDFAAEADAKDILEYIASKNDAILYVVEKNGVTLLHRAVFGNAPNVVPVLKPQVNAKDSFGFTPLHYAGQYNCPEIVPALVEQGADINAASNTGLTPLMVAAQCNNKPIVEEMLKIKGLEANKKDSNGWTALHHASHSSSFNIITTLIQGGCDPYAKNNAEQTPKETASGLFAKKCYDLVGGSKLVIGDVCNPGKCPTYTQYTEPDSQSKGGCNIA